MIHEFQHQGRTYRLTVECLSEPDHQESLASVLHAALLPEAPRYMPRPCKPAALDGQVVTPLPGTVCLLYTSFLAIAGEYEEAIRQVNGYWNYLYNPEHQLMHWMWDDAEKKVAWPNFRSICNGFAIAGMTRVALALPESMREECDELVCKTMLVVDGMLRVTGEDGYSHCTYEDPATHVAMNGALILAGVLYRLLSKNLIDRGRYLPIANRLRMSCLLYTSRCV